MKLLKELVLCNFYLQIRMLIRNYLRALEVLGNKEFCYCSNFYILLTIRNNPT